MPTLQSILAKPGNVDLGDDTYDLEGTVGIGNRVVTGSVAKIRIAPSDKYRLPAIVIRNDAGRLLGDVEVIGPMPTGTPYDEHKEAQHGIEVQGATNYEIAGWYIHNVFGNPISLGKNDAGEWARKGHIHDVRTDEAGRQSFNVDAAIDTLVENMDFGRSNLSVFAAEPPGGQWGYRWLRWKNSVVRDSGGGAVFASRGKGAADMVHDLLLDGINCTRRIFDVVIEAPENVRRRNFTIRNCDGTGQARQPALRFRRCDDITVENVTQRMTTGSMVDAKTCTDVTVDGKKIA